MRAAFIVVAAVVVVVVVKAPFVKYVSKLSYMSPRVV